MIFGGRASQDGAASEDLDASVVDVKINDEELEQFDEDSVTLVTLMIQ